MSQPVPPERGPDFAWPNPRCPNGHEVVPGAAFCPSCGSAVGSAASPTKSGLGSLAASLNAKPQRWLVKAAACVAALALLGVIAAVSISGSKQTIKGTFTLFDSDVTGSPTDCQGTGGYDDVDAGVKVTVRDQDDRIVGSAALRNGSSVKQMAARIAAVEESGVTVSEAEQIVQNGGESLCVLVFDAEVKDAEFYDIEVGKRGKISKSKEQLESDDWHVGFTLGD